MRTMIATAVQDPIEGLFDVIDASKVARLVGGVAWTDGMRYIARTKRRVCKKNHIWTTDTLLMYNHSFN